MNQMISSAPSPLWPALNGAGVLIVGGSSGIGLGGAQLLARLGAHVTIAGRSIEKLEKARDSIGGNVSIAAVDGRSAQSVSDLFAQVGAFDHLVITLTGRLGGGRFAEVDLGEFRQAFEEKFWPHLTLAQASLKTLSPTGSITFVTGAAARKVSAGGSGFAAINGAIEIITPTLARELAPRRVNAVSPGFVATPWYDHIPEKELREAERFAAANLPVGRIGTTEDVAHALLYVIANGFVTGSVIECDGGARVASDTPDTGLPK